MNTAYDVDMAGQRSGRAGDPDALDPDTPRAIDGRGRPQASVAAGQMAEEQRTAAEGRAAIDSPVAVQAVAPAEQRRDNAARPPSEPRPTPVSALADAQTLKSLDIRNRVLQTLALGKLGVVGPAEEVDPRINTMRPEGNTTEMRRAIPPLEDRFNVKRIGLIEMEYRFRDQAGHVAFTDKFLSISTGSESTAAIKAMVDRAAERGWETVRLNGSPEFVRQGWIAATAQGLLAVGHTATVGDREAASKEQARLQTGHGEPAPLKPGEAIGRLQSQYAEHASGHGISEALSGLRQLAAAIEKALVDGKVSPELRGQVGAMMAAEGAKRLAGGARFKIPLYGAHAPRGRAKTVQTGPHRHGDRERSR